MAAAEVKPGVRLVLQQCLSANLKLPPSYTSESEVCVRRGVVAFVCFMKGAEEETAIKAAQAICGLELSEPEEGTADKGSKRISALASAADILIIPQATLGGKLKGKRWQYHGCADKTLGEGLFDLVVAEVRKAVSGDARVERGVYGARQVLAMETNGPYTHIHEF